MICGLRGRQFINSALLIGSSVSNQTKRGFRNLWKSRKQNSFGSFQPIKSTGLVHLPPRSVPPSISHPPYGPNVDPPLGPQWPEVKTAEQIEHMRASCSLARRTLNFAKELVKVGATTEDIDCQVHDYILSNGAYPSPLNYKNFPKSVCTSVNNVICHGIPDDRPLQDGDIINVDVTVFFNGYHGDVSETFLVGDVDEPGRNLVAVTKRCLDEAVAVCQPGRPYNHIGAVIENCARKHGLQVVPAFTGHGIGAYFHGAPDIFHFKNKFPGRMEAGHTFTIEPALSQGTQQCIILEDGWTAVTADGSRSAQFEYTVLITDSGVEVLT